MANTFLAVMLKLTGPSNNPDSQCDQKGKEVRHKDRFFVTSTPEAQTRRLPRLVHLLFDRYLTSAH